ncbi:TetR/AcrR family transcriptional regulator [Nesterenkonia sp. CF4.4]|uniref:TetR/AcrR family transcriptional regulator n=1 Tax=Nesterenkonia sp. CF4.4 TaxID=3373079 RepID=UPI003EE79AC5
MSRTALPRGQYKKSPRRREEILDAAFEVFSHTGYLNASETEIARAANFTLPGLRHHYASKSVLFEAVITRRDMQAQDHLVNRTGIDLLRGLVEIARRDEADPRATRLFAIVSAEATDPDHEMHDYFRRRYLLILDNVTSALSTAQSLGQLQEDIDPEYGAKRYVALSDGLQLQSLFDPERTRQAETLQRGLQELLTVEL